MKKHVVANLWLLCLTLVICSVLYPLALGLIGRVVFAEKAKGSIIEIDGKPVGSRLIAQPFTSDEYFHPRPSAVSYNAAAAGGSNWGANNPALRKRVVASLGSILKYRDGRPVEPDIVAWVRSQLKENPDIIQQWSQADPGLAERWGAVDQNDDAIVPGVFFEVWWKNHPDIDVQPVPADMVMASGAGLDPHITLKSAQYQLDRVAAAWSKKTNRPAGEIRSQIEDLLEEHATAPLGGLAGPPLVNVLEVNLALPSRLKS
jgi:K+-transporting ATPase ATPase C chain